mmetsp:Transcript_64/g.269  ORF Transcript_64/g.269 Transcript_64/m.269 type:complete len:273 (+) Transcript_64:399-1217(+)
MEKNRKKKELCCACACGLRRGALASHLPPAVSLFERPVPIEVGQEPIRQPPPGHHPVGGVVPRQPRPPLCLVVVHNEGVLEGVCGGKRGGERQEPGHGGHGGGGLRRHRRRLVLARAALPREPLVLLPGAVHGVHVGSTQKLREAAEGDALEGVRSPCGAALPRPHNVLVGRHVARDPGPKVEDDGLLGARNAQGGVGFLLGLGRWLHGGGPHLSLLLDRRPQGLLVEVQKVLGELRGRLLHRRRSHRGVPPARDLTQTVLPLVQSKKSHDR